VRRTRQNIDLLFSNPETNFEKEIRCASGIVRLRTQSFSRSMAPLKFEGQLKRFDITISRASYAEKYETWEDLHKKLVGWCAHFAFQMEKGESGYEHWQCRVQLIHKKTCAAILKDDGPVKAIGGNWQVTSSGIHPGPKQFAYVMKEDTRIEGPWDDSACLMEKPPLTRQLHRFMEHEFYAWQAKVFGIVQEEDDRWIHLVYDKVGNVGKSVFLEFLEYQGLAFEMPPLRHMEDIMEFAHSFPPQKAYIIDMPRGMKKDKLADFYAALECIKNGVTYDKRYVGKKRRMSRPQILVFTNTLPAFELMSMDRWRIHEMQPDKSCKEYTAEEYVFTQNFTSGGDQSSRSGVGRKVTTATGENVPTGDNRLGFQVDQTPGFRIRVPATPGCEHFDPIIGN